MKSTLITMLLLNIVSINDDIVKAVLIKNPSDDNLKNMIEASLIQEAA